MTSSSQKLTAITEEHYSQIFQVYFNFKYSGLLWEKCELIFGLGNMVRGCNAYSFYPAESTQIVCGERGKEEVDVEELGRVSGSATPRELPSGHFNSLSSGHLFPWSTGNALFSFLLSCTSHQLLLLGKIAGQVCPLRWSWPTWNLGSASLIYCSVKVISTWEAILEKVSL